MLLSECLHELAPLPVISPIEISGLTLDSRKVQPGYIFCVLGGQHTSGVQYIEEAVERGAAAIICDESLWSEIPPYSFNLPIIPISSLQHQVGLIANRFYQYPSQKLKVIGVTGTSGKTSCTQFIAQALSLSQTSCGVIGTSGAGFLPNLETTGFTTPDAITLQSLLATLAKQSAQVIAMEVTSHGIDQGRVNGIEFELGIFTNLSQDHLDYHDTMEAYAAVKKKFLHEFPIKQLILNADDHYAVEWVSELSLKKPVFTYSLKKDNASIYITSVSYSLTGMRVSCVSTWGQGDFFVPVIGDFNLSNVLAVIASLCGLGFSFKETLERIEQIQSIPGRMQILGGGQFPWVIIDYAHKPDALLNVLQTLRKHFSGRLLTIFGCGGERDKSKRPLMATIAEEHSDKIIITNDNPRNEDPEHIVADILQGFKHPTHVQIELDRAKAIYKGLQWAEPEDCVLIAGKGSEQYQYIGNKKIPFDDVTEVERYLSCVKEKH